MNGMKKPWMIAATAAVLALALTGCGGTVERISEEVIGEGSGSGEVAAIARERFDAGTFDQVKIDALAMMIEVTGTSKPEASVEFLADESIDNEFEFHAEVRNRTLEISIDEQDAEDSWFTVDRNEGERKLVVAVPERELAGIAVDAEFGSVKAEGFQADKLDVRLSAGAIRVSRVEAKMDLRTEAGNIDVEDVALERDLKAATDAGNIDIRLAEAPKAAKLMLESELGKVSSKLEGADYSVDDWNAKIGSIGKGGPRLEASTEVGRVSVE